AQQRIEIYAEYRRPVAWIAMPFLPSGERVTGAKNLGNLAQCRSEQAQRHYYLIDEDLVRLPGEYTEADRAAMSGLMTLYGVDENVPLPGVAWGSPEIVAGLKLIDTLKGQPYLQQISAINMSNYGGRISESQPQLTLETVWQTTDQLPRM